MCILYFDFWMISEPQYSTLKLSKIYKNYGKKAVLHGISIEAKTGECTAIMGPNGAGKTTCFYIIVGLVEDFIGSVYIDDKNISKLPTYMRARLGIGYLPQESSIFRDMTVQDNIISILEFTDPNRTNRLNRCMELLHLFNITHLQKVRAGALSGGERRRLEIARCLAINPSFVLLDEPFAGIDPVSVGDIIELINTLKKQNIGVIITDHNVRETLKIADTSYIFYNGNIVAQGTKNVILNNEDVKKYYLGTQFEME